MRWHSGGREERPLGKRSRKQRRRARKLRKAVRAAGGEVGFPTPRPPPVSSLYPMVPVTPFTEALAWGLLFPAAAGLLGLACYLDEARAIRTSAGEVLGAILVALIPWSSVLREGIEKLDRPSRRNRGRSNIGLAGLWVCGFGFALWVMITEYFPREIVDRLPPYLYAMGIAPLVLGVLRRSMEYPTRPALPGRSEGGSEADRLEAGAPEPHAPAGAIRFVPEAGGGSHRENGAPADLVGAHPCQYCGADLGRGPQVRCAGCDTPHHADCWDEAGGCTTFGCGGTRTA